MLDGSPLALAIGIGKSRSTCGVTVAQVPDHTATDADWPVQHPIFNAMIYG